MNEDTKLEAGDHGKTIVGYDSLIIENNSNNNGINNSNRNIKKEESSEMLNRLLVPDGGNSTVSVVSFSNTIGEENIRDYHNRCHDNSSHNGGSSLHGSHRSFGSVQSGNVLHVGQTKIPLPSLRTLALELSLYVNLFITLTKLMAYLQTMSLSVLAALLDSVLDVVSQIVLNYTEKHSSIQRSSAFYPAGASRLEPIGVLTCAALMGMASFEVLKESTETLIYGDNPFDHANGAPNLLSFWSMVAIVVVKVLLLLLCQKAAESKTSNNSLVGGSSTYSNNINGNSPGPAGAGGVGNSPAATGGAGDNNTHLMKAAVQLADPTLEALGQDHWNDALSNGVAAIALLFALRSPSLWFLDPIGAIIISFYIIYSWYYTGREQIEQLTGKCAPQEFIDELLILANSFIDDRIMCIDVCRAYHFGPKFLVELEIVLPKETPLCESHDLGMELQYEIEGLDEVERCFVHIDYEQRPYDEHVVSKVPELREKYRPGNKLLRYRSHASI